MDERERLLNEARKFCDPVSGEVVERIPDDLMQRLRAARLAVGIRGEETLIATSAKWFVFLNDDIRDHVSPRWREERRGHHRNKRRQHGSRVPAPTSDTHAHAVRVQTLVHGLRGFLPRRQSGQ
jgi:hypothetical protein